MIPFGVKVALLRVYLFILKFVTWLLPFKTPMLFVGPGSSRQMAATMAHTGVRKVLLVTDAMLLKLGVVNGILEELKSQGVEVEVYDGITPDPSIQQIEGGLSLLKQKQCEAILAVGGGSSIDAAKVIALRATNDKAIASMVGVTHTMLSLMFGKAPFPLYAVPTTAGTGSEVTIAAVVSDPEQKRKLPIMDLSLVPKMAALDGELAKGLPAHITAATGMDALTHAVEAYISLNRFEHTDQMAIAATRLIMKYLDRAVKNGADDIEARQSMSLASYYAGFAFTQAGVGYVHAIAHNFGAHYHTPHGLANAIVMPYVLDFSKSACIRRLAELADVAELRAPGDTDAVAADKFIARIREMNKEFGIPEHLDALQATDISAIAAAALDEARFTYNVPRMMDQADCEAVVRRMLV
ncbi:MAG: iron-containing alcohol dehydrogenase [Hahellaceae bacterium]|nr:iron-containing alcohol dehydrogenase [Hahellaceae bacterium]MCP5168245.1 iron-containing alcohol dehydrogenase [Hahellaceae bacterium]